MIVYSDNAKRAAEGFHKTSVCPCEYCTEFRWLMSEEGSAENRKQLIEQLAKEM